ncbi:isomerase [Streptomyces sp. NPDC048266]|uniref:isomerase n=1 Tax=unclassified Streptomyces TaxID=2593676 RepID=UPI0033C707FA
MTEAPAAAAEQHTEDGTGSAYGTGADGTLERYVRFWNAPTESEQRRLAAATFADRVEYRAEIGVLVGEQALMDFRNGFVGHVGTARLRLRERPRVHHDRARVKWEILTGEDAGDGAREAAPFATGTDVLVLDEDGRISSVTAFLDRAPEGFDPHGPGAGGVGGHDGG